MAPYHPRLGVLFINSGCHILLCLVVLQIRISLIVCLNSNLDTAVVGQNLMNSMSMHLIQLVGLQAICLLTYPTTTAGKVSRSWPALARRRSETQPAAG